MKERQTGNVQGWLVPRAGLAALLLSAHRVFIGFLVHIAHGGCLVIQQYRVCSAKNLTLQEEDEDSDDSGGSNDGWGLIQRACRYYESGSFQGELLDFRR